MTYRKFMISDALASSALLVPAVAAAPAHASGDEVCLTAGLRGANEVGAPGDKDGRSTVVLKISGNEVTFAARWNKIGTPTAGHVHAGEAPVPAKVVRRIAANPGAYYSSLHTTESVRGTAVTRTPNGDNIPELVLDATQAGAGTGLLAHTTQILRLNTTGGLAPTGSCRSGAQAEVPYGADYVFLG